MGKNIRNVCLVGHSGHGKTTLAEAMLFMTKATSRFGKISDGNTVLDYDKEEIKRGFSISLAVAPITWKNTKINFIDTPGYLDFYGEVAEGVSVADSAVIVVDGKSGADVGTELAWERASERGIPKAFFINRFDDPEAKFERVFDDLREKFGSTVCPIVIPMIDGGKVVGFLDLIDMREYVYDKDGKHQEAEIPASFVETAKKYRNELLESIAVTSEELMEKVLMEEEVTREEAVEAIHIGFNSGDIVPVICGAAATLNCVDVLLDQISDYFPSPEVANKAKVIDGEEVKTVTLSESDPTSVFVFKTIADPFVGKMSFFRVMSGSLKRDTSLKNPEKGTTEKFGHIFTICGKDMKEVEEIEFGDIGVTTKLANVNTNDTLSAAPAALPYAKIVTDEPCMRIAVAPKAKGDEEKISQGIQRLCEEDLTLRFENNPDTKQFVLTAAGDIHADVTLSKLKTRYGVSVDTSAPKIAYKEAIKGRSDVQGKHKKQSGGHGQYGDVKIRFAPGDNGLEFTESCVGGSVPKNFHPAVIKGLEEAMQEGVLAGFPMVGLKADLYDGSYHEVDSSEMSFKLAARLAYKEGMVKAGPIILEPIGDMKVTVPGDYIGDVMGTITKKRGRVMGINQAAKKGYQVVEAEVPFSEVADYPTVLRAMTQGRGKYTIEFIRYEEVPAQNAEKIAKEALAAKKDEQ